MIADSNLMNAGTEGILDLINLYYADTSDWNKEGKAELIAMLNELLPPYIYSFYNCVIILNH